MLHHIPHAECVDDTDPPSVHCIKITSEIKVEADTSNSLQTMDKRLLNTVRESMSPVSHNLANMVNNADVIEIVFLEPGIVVVSPIVDKENLENKFPLGLAGITVLLLGSSFLICVSIIVAGKRRKKYQEQSNKMLSVSTDDHLGSDKTSSEWDNNVKVVVTVASPPKGQDHSNASFDSSVSALSYSPQNMDVNSSFAASEQPRHLSGQIIVRPTPCSTVSLSSSSPSSPAVSPFPAVSFDTL